MSGSRWKGRGDAVAAAALLILSTAFFADILFGTRTFYYGDLTTYFRGATAGLREIILAGEFPSWNRYFSAGQPMAANPEFSVFYPIRYLVLLPDFETGWKLHLWIHFPIAAIGMYSLLRSMELRRISAVFGAVSFAFGGFLLSYVSIPPFFFTVAWLPVTLLFSRKFLKGGQLVDFAAAACSLGLQLLAGEPTTVLQTVILIAAYAIYEGLIGEAKGKRLSRNTSLTAAIVVAAALLAAVQVLPMIDHARQTVRARGLTFEQVRWWSMPPLRALELLFPDFMGPLHENQRWYWGRALYSHWTGPYLPRIYIGLLPALLAIAGVIARARGWALYLALLLGSLLVSAGDHTPLLTWLYQAGLFSSFRYPEKFILTAVVSTAIFGSAAFDAILRGDPRVAKVTFRLAVAVTCLTAAAFALANTKSYAQAWTALWDLPPGPLGDMVIEMSAGGWLLASARGIGAIAVLWFMTRSKDPAGAWSIVAVAVLLADLLPLNAAVARRIDQSFFDPPPLAAALNSSEPPGRIFHEADLLEQLRDPTDPRGRMAGDARYAQLRNGLYGRLASAYGLETVLENDYDLSNVRSTTSFFSAFLTAYRQQEDATIDRLLRLSDVAVRLRPGNSPNAPVIPLRVSALPRYYFAETLVPIRTGQDFVNRVREWNATDRVAFVGTPAMPLAKGEISSVAERKNSVDLDVNASGTAFLVLTVTWDRYWSALIDDRPARVLRTNLGYQGLFVPAGRHRISVRYRNPLITAGAAISVAALLGVALIVLRSRQALASSSTARSTASGVGTAASR